MRPLSLDEMRANTAMRRLREDDARRAAERLAAYRADPEGYLARKRAIGAPAVPPPGAEPAAPSLADLSEMRSSFLLSELADWCKRQRRDELKEHLNQAFRASRLGLKVIRWEAWA